MTITLTQWIFLGVLYFVLSPIFPLCAIACYIRLSNSKKKSLDDFWNNWVGCSFEIDYKFYAGKFFFSLGLLIWPIPSLVFFPLAIGCIVGDLIIVKYNDLQIKKQQQEQIMERALRR